MDPIIIARGNQLKDKLRGLGADFKKVLIASKQSAFLSGNRANSYTGMRLIGDQLDRLSLLGYKNSISYDVDNINNDVDIYRISGMDDKLIIKGGVDSLLGNTYDDNKDKIEIRVYDIRNGELKNITGGRRRKHRKHTKKTRKSRNRTRKYRS
jgi:hypothetical protein